MIPDCHGAFFFHSVENSSQIKDIELLVLSLVGKSIGVDDLGRMREIDMVLPLDFVLELLVKVLVLLPRYCKFIFQLLSEGFTDVLVSFQLTSIYVLNCGRLRFRACHLFRHTPELLGFAGGCFVTKLLSKYLTLFTIEDAESVS